MSLSHVFSFSCPRISASLKFVRQLLPPHVLCDCFTIKQTPHLHKSILYLHKITTSCNLTHFLLPSVVELRKNKTRCFQKLRSKFFYNIVRSNGMKGWKVQVSLSTMLSIATPVTRQHCKICILPRSIK